MREQNIEKLFKDTFSNFEADVNPNAWANISAGLQTPVPVQEIAGNAASAGKSMGLWGYAGMFVAATAIVVTALVYNSGDETSDKTIVPLKSNPAVEVRLTEPPPIDETPVAVNPAVTQKAQPENNNTKQEPVAPVVQEEKETVVEEKEPAVNTPSEVTPPASVDPDREAIANGNQSVEPKPVAEDVNTDVTEKAAPAVSEIPLTTENDFVMMTEQVDNGVPHEQESRADFTFYIPTVFTPNGDRANDDFKPMGLYFKDYELVIYDAGSNVVFRSNDIEQSWDGKLKDGTLAPRGNYVCVISVKDLNNVEHPYRGPLLLKR